MTLLKVDEELFVCGDATGHGVVSGIMVSVTSGLTVLKCQIQDQ